MEPLPRRLEESSALFEQDVVLPFVLAGYADQSEFDVRGLERTAKRFGRAQALRDILPISPVESIKTRGVLI